MAQALDGISAKAAFIKVCENDSAALSLHIDDYAKELNVGHGHLVGEMGKCPETPALSSMSTYPCREIPIHEYLTLGFTCEARAGVLRRLNLKADSVLYNTEWDRCECSGARGVYTNYGKKVVTATVAKCRTQRLIGLKTKKIIEGERKKNQWMIRAASTVEREK